jgi:hypothetical protein
MHTVKDESAAHRRRAIRPGVSRPDESAVSVFFPPRPHATSVEMGDFDADERFTIEASLCSCQRPSHIEWLVQLFVVSTRYVPRTAQRLLEPSDLPPALERVAVRAQRCLQTWFAWTDGPKIWFVVTETVPSRQHHERALRLFFYDEDGRFVCWGTWALQSRGSWILCER